MNTPEVSNRDAAMVPFIGVVESPWRDINARYDYASESSIRIHDRFIPGFTAIEYFSHIWVIYHQHLSQEWVKVRGWGDEAPLILPADDDRCGQGVFSSRAPCRPAKLGSCIVELVRRLDDVLVVRGLDAVNGTAIVDIKVYVPEFDAFPQATIPLHWAKVMEGKDDLSKTGRNFHWDNTNADFALGQKMGLLAMERLGSRRGRPLRASVKGSLFFAQGFEMTTGCSPLRGTLHWDEKPRAAHCWETELHDGRSSTLLQPRRLDWTDAASVLAASEDELLETTNHEINRTHERHRT